MMDTSFDNKAFRDDVLTNLQNALVMGVYTVVRDGLKYKLSEEDNNIVEIIGLDNYDFEGNEGVLHLAGADKVAKGAFSFIDAITEVEGYDIIAIDKDAFLKCNNLVKVNLPKVKELGESSLAYNFKLTSVDAPECVELKSEALACCFTLSSLNLPKLETCKSRVFKSCYNLTEVEFDNLTDIGVGLFKDCINLIKVRLRNFEGYSMSETFKGCKNLKIVELPKAKAISDDTFIGAEEIEEIIAPKIIIRDDVVASLKHLCVLYISYISKGDSYDRAEEPTFIKENCIKKYCKL